MYGMVNQAVEALIVKKFGAEDWKAICESAGIPDEGFEGMLSYPDDITYKLVGVISKKYDIPTEDVLKVFGDHFVDFTGTTEFGSLLRFAGRNLIERLNSLDEMHSRIKLSLPHLRPPSFEFEEGEDGLHKLHYGSEREGLEHMVIGLVKGLARQTGEAVEITLDPEPADAEFRATFTIRLQKIPCADGGNGSD